jgi:multiple sugar transport system ATP-binding protein
MADRIGVLEAGRLLQVGLPREIYDRPASINVARRLGSPQINLLPVEALPGLSPPVAARSVGFRPEDLRLDGQGLAATATQVEHLGAETVVRLRAGEHLLHALIVGGSALQPGAAIRVALPPEALLFFDGAGGRIAA